MFNPLFYLCLPMPDKHYYAPEGQSAPKRKPEHERNFGSIQN